IRPANIMAVGALFYPDAFFLGGYWRFSIDKARGGGAPSGHTMIGPGVGGARERPFFSGEGRAGGERGNAAKAICLDDPGSGTDEYVIRLGWSSELFLQEDGSVDRDKVVTDKLRNEIIDSASKSADARAVTDDTLQAGDRIRLRDYVFEIKRARSLGSRGAV